MEREERHFDFKKRFLFRRVKKQYGFFHRSVLLANVYVYTFIIVRQSAEKEKGFPIFHEKREKGILIMERGNP